MCNDDGPHPHPEPRCGAPRSQMSRWVCHASRSAVRRTRPVRPRCLSLAAAAAAIPVRTLREFIASRSYPAVFAGSDRQLVPAVRTVGMDDMPLRRQCVVYGCSASDPEVSSLLSSSVCRIHM